MTPVYLDTDFLVRAVSAAGPAREELLALNARAARLQMSSVAWYEFARGPRTPEQLALARFLLDEVTPFTEGVATRAGEVFRSLGSPRRRANDIAIGVSAVESGGRLLTSNHRDFHDIPELVLEASP